MTTIDNNPIIISVKLQAGKNPIGLPPDTLLDVKIKIIDEHEFIKTSSAGFTRDLVKIEKLKPTVPGTQPFYSERNQTAIIKFPHYTKLEIAKLVRDDLAKLGVKE